MGVLRRDKSDDKRKFKMREKLMSIGDDCWIEDESGKVHGNIVDHEYDVDRDGDKIAEVSKKWFRLRDTYGVEIEQGQNDILILAVTACIDQMVH